MALDLSLIHLPIKADPRNAEVALSDRASATTASKRGFWGSLAKRIDLTGKGSHVRSRPWGAMPDGDLGPLAAVLEAVTDQIEAKMELSVMMDESKMGSLNLWRKQEHLLKEVTPQFTLRNIPRITRENTPRRLPITYAVWREDEEVINHFTAVRRPRHQTPELIEELSSVWVHKITKELYDTVNDFDWAEAVGGRVGPAPRRPGPPGATGPERVPIGELSMKAAPPNRKVGDQKFGDGMKALIEKMERAKKQQE